MKVIELPKQSARPGACCAMKLTTKHHTWNSKGIECPWKPVVMIGGKPLCWIHHKAVEAGYRLLPT